MTEADDTANGRIEKSAHKVETASDKLVGMVKALGFVVTILVVVVIILAWAVHSNSQNIEDLDQNVESIQGSVDHAENFIEGLELETEDEAARNAAISEAVRLVPEIRSILCEQFPDAQACRPLE